MKSALRLLALVSLALLVAGCAERPMTFYLFGPAASCFDAAIATEPSACDRLKVYDRVELRVTPEQNEVAYVRTAVGLDDGNVVFRKLAGCAVVSRDAFGCPGLAYSDGRFIEAGVFRGLSVSRSSAAYLASAYAGATFSRETLQTVARHQGLLGGMTVIVGVMVLVAVVAAFA